MDSSGHVVKVEPIPSISADLRSVPFEQPNNFCIRGLITDELRKVVEWVVKSHEEVEQSPPYMVYDYAGYGTGRVQGDAEAFVRKLRKHLQSEFHQLKMDVQVE